LKQVTSSFGLRTKISKQKQMDSMQKLQRHRLSLDVHIDLIKKYIFLNLNLNDCLQDRDLFIRVFYFFKKVWIKSFFVTDIEPMTNHFDKKI